MQEYECEQTVHFKIQDGRKKGPFTSYDESAASSSSSSSSSSDWNIDFNFSCRPFIFEWVLREDSEEPQLMRNYDLPVTKKHIRINRITILGERAAREIIDEEFKCMGVWSENRRLLTDFAMKKAREVVKSMPPSHNTVHLTINVNLVHKHVFDERHDVGLALQWSMDEDTDHLVPAADSSIEALEKKKIILISEDSETCTICLEEFSEACEGICMPCSHFFHGDCIKNWLRTSHYCPLCRFEMPTGC